MYVKKQKQRHYVLQLVRLTSGIGKNTEQLELSHTTGGG